MPSEQIALPELSGDHKNIVFNVQGDDGSRAWRAFKGKAVLFEAVTEWICENCIQDSVEGVEQRRALLVAQKPLKWALQYKLLSKRNVSSSVAITSTSGPKIELLHALLGSLDREVALTWVNALLNQDASVDAEQPKDPAPPAPPPASAQPRTGTPKAVTPPARAASQVSTPLSPLRSSISSPESPGESEPNYLPIINERAQRLRAELGWVDTSEGPPHIQHWTSRLCLDDAQTSAIGHGDTKKRARNAAAKIALDQHLLLVEVPKRDKK